MTEAEVKEIADQIFKEDLGRFGFHEVKVSIGVDEEGEEFFDITSYFKRAKKSLPPRASIRATSRLRHALSAKGEDRFPLVVHILPEPKAA